MSARLIREMLEVLRRRDRALIRRSLITAVNDSGPVQLLSLKGIFGAIRQGVEAFQPFGFSSNPPASGSEVVHLQVNGDPAHHVVVVAFNRQYRITGLQPGESIMFNQSGDFIKLDASRNATVSAAGKVTVNSPNAEFTGNVKIDGTLAVGKLATFSSGASVAKGNLTIGATAQVLVTTVGSLKISGTPVSAP